jgi:aminoglycoside phosphotransferase (APT) family kinase protein
MQAERRQGFLADIGDTSELAAETLLRIAAQLRGEGLALDVDAGARRFTGGLANRNYLIRVNDGPAVLRCPPLGDLPRGAHDMRREFELLTALRPSFPIVPNALAFCGDVTVMGTPFQVLEYCQGVILHGKEAVPADRAHELSHMLAGTLARLHAVDAEAAGLGRLGRPEGFVSRQIDGWVARATAVDSQDIAPAIVDLAYWLGRQRLAPRAACLLHCDFKLNNLILAPDTLQPVALIDWDMGTRGDPLFDLATLLSYWSESGDPPAMLALRQMPTTRPGWLSRREMVDLYAKLTGRDVSDFPVFRVLALLKLGVVFLQLHQRWLSGGLGDSRYVPGARDQPDRLRPRRRTRRRGLGRAAWT